MIKPSTIFTGDNLPILRGMDSASVDLIYLDPPFNSNRHYSAPIGSKAAGAEFKDTWTLEDTDDAWWGELADAHPALYRVIDAAGAVGGKRDKAYCIYMAVRLLEMHRVLKSTGALYLHCDQTMSHSLKLVLDAIFRKKNFKNEIVWHYFKPHGSKTNYPKNYDSIFFYTKSKSYIFNPEACLFEYDEKAVKRYDKIDEEGKRYKIYFGKDGKERIAYLKAGKPENVFKIPFIQGTSKERLGYPTQKPLKLLQRIVQASSNKGGVVLDPFCGCATACLAAESLQRQWIGIDISPKAFELINVRLKKELGGIFSQVIHRTDIPARVGGKRSKDIKHILFGKQEGLCNGCRSAFEFRNFEIDHIVPKDAGGANDDHNLQLLCGWCNRKKGNRSMEYLKAELIRDGILSK